MSTALGNNTDGNQGQGNQGSAGGGGTGGSGQGSSSQGGSTSQGGSQGNSGPWYADLPDRVKNHPHIQNYKTRDAWAESWVDAQSALGRKGIIPPGEKASGEEWERFYNDLGRPPIEKYNLEAPQGKKVDEHLLKWFKENAHKSGLLPKQAQAMLEKYVEFEEQTVKSHIEATQGKVKEELDSLRKEWGQGWDRQIGFAKLAVQKLGAEEGGQGNAFLEYLEQTGLGNDVRIIKFLNKVGKLLGEDKLVGDGSGRMGMTPREIQAQIDDIYANPKHPARDSTHPGHTAAVQKMNELYQKLAESQAS